MNGATCFQVANNYRCDCREGFTGKVCDVRMVSCDVAASLKSKWNLIVREMDLVRSLVLFEKRFSEITGFF